MKNKIISIFFLLIFLVSCRNKEMRKEFFYPNGDVAIELKKYDHAFSFFEGLAAVKKNDKYGFINKSGDLVIDCQFDYAIAFSDSLCAVGINGRIGFIDKKGNIKINPQYVEVSSFKNGYAAFFSKEKTGYINKNGDVVIDAEYENMSVFEEGLINLQKNGKWGYLDNNNVVIDFQYDFASPFKNNLALVSLNGKYGYINKKNEIIIPLEYDEFENGGILSDLEGYETRHIISASETEQTYLYTNRNFFINNDNISDDTIILNKDNVFQLWNIDGVMIIETDFIIESEFVNNYCICSKNFNDEKRFFLMNNSGKIVYEAPKFYNLSVIANNGWIRFRDVSLDEGGFLKITGETRILREYDTVYNFINDYAQITKDKMMGMIDSNLDLVVPAEYFHVDFESEGLILVTK